MNTGRDLVAMQIEQARGKLAHLDQRDILARGHAIECRLYAENPAKNFMPSPGRLVRFALPGPSDDLRIDTGFREGDEVTFFYDPLLAKVIAHGATRDDAIERMVDALDAIEIEGPATNVAFLRATMRHPEFRAGNVFTGFVDRFKGELARV
jgi:acetyl/propionyl-CoA carboxylase alpha subunit